jgi:hypothetical protein
MSPKTCHQKFTGQKPRRFYTDKPSDFCGVIAIYFAEGSVTGVWPGQLAPSFRLGMAYAKRMTMDEQKNRNKN